MTAAVQQIVRAYETLNLSLEDIASELDLDIEAVRSCLLQFSNKFRLEFKKDRALDFNEDDLEQSNNAMREMMLTTEDENLRFRIAKYIRNDKKGRLDMAKAMVGLNINVIEFNDMMNKARLSMERTRELKQVKDITSDKPSQPAPSRAVVEAELVETK